MKKLLILAYDFPLYKSIGVQRPYSWYTYFKEFGWKPIVITRHWNSNIKNGRDYIKPSINQSFESKETEQGFIRRAPLKPNLRDKMLLKFGLNKFSKLRKTLTLFYKLTEFYIPLFDNRKTIFIAARKYLKKNKVDAIIATGEPFILFKYAYI